MILFLLLAYFFYIQFRKINWNEDSFYIQNPFFIVLALILVPLNWFLEWLKWNSTLQILEIQVNDPIKKYAFLAGIVTGMLTPNMLGNFIGRIYYFERKHRIGLIILTLATNYAQFIASILFGIVAILFLNKTPFEFPVSQLSILLIICSLLVILLYFNFEWIFKFFKRKVRIHLLIRNLQKRRVYRWKILLLSLIRHAIFTTQFLLVLQAFGEEFSLINILWVWQLYLWVTLVPSLFMGKLGIRESISIWVLGMIGMGELTVLISSFIIWTMNLLIPTIAGVIICKRQPN